MNARLTDVHHVGLNRFHAYTGLESALTELPKLENGATYGYQFYAQDTGNTYLFNESTNTYDLVKSSGGGGNVGEGVLTLTQGDETLGTFSANATEDTTIALKTTSTVTENDNSLVTSGGVKTAIDNAILTRLTTHICVDGEYDTETLEPTLEGDPKTLYLTPKATDDEVNAYIEWLYVNEKFERIGSTEVVIESIDNATIDAITNDEAVATDAKNLQTTGLTYLWAKLKAKFAPLTHTHQSADITDLGTATLTVKSGDDTLGTFGANATEDVEIKIDKATVNDGKLTLKLMEGTSISTSEFSANQETDTETTIRTVPQNGSEYNYLRATSSGYYKWEEPASMVTTDNPCLVASNTIADHLTNNYAQKTHTHKMADVTDLEIGDGQLTLNIDDGEVPSGQETGTKTFTANQGSDVSVDIRNVPFVEQSTASEYMYLRATSTSYKWETPAEDITTESCCLVASDTVAEHLTNNYAQKTHTHSSADITDLGTATLTLKKGETTLGTFGANATENVSVDLGEDAEVNDGKLTLTVNDGMEQTSNEFTANQSADKTVYLNAVPENNTTGYLYNESSGTYSWVQPATTVSTTNTKLIQSSVIASHLQASYAPLASPALTGTPSAPTATAGTSSTQIATTAFVMNLMKPTVVLNGTDTNYVSAFSNRVTIENILLIKSGYNYTMDIKYSMNSSARSTYAAGDSWNVMNAGSTLQSLIGSSPCFGTFSDNASTGDYAGIAMLTPAKNYFAISSNKDLTVVNSSVYHMLLSFVGSAE